MTFDTFAEPWWPYLFILLAGILPTEVWRWIGVVASGRLREDSPRFALVRAIATALVAAVIARMVISPTGSLAEAPLVLRLTAVALGFAALELSGRRIWVGILVGEAALLGGIALL